MSYNRDDSHLMATRSDLTWEGAGYNMVMRELKHREYYSPDVKELFKYEYHLVFIYNNLKRGMDNHAYFLKNSIYLGEAQSIAEYFMMKRTPSDAVVFRNDRDKIKRTIVGELYACPPEDVLKLDSFHANNTLFERTKTYFSAKEQVSPFKQGVHRPVVEAFYYEGIEEAWENYELRFATAYLGYGRPAWCFDHRERFMTD